MTDTNTPLGLMTQRGPTVLWNDSATYTELSTAISWGAVGATCNPVIALAAIRADLPRWTARIKELAAEMPDATESQIGWKVVEEVSTQSVLQFIHRCGLRPQQSQCDARVPQSE